MRTIEKKSIAMAVLAAAIIALPSMSARAEIINLRCHYSRSPDNPSGLVYWVDMDRNTITWTGVGSDNSISVDSAQTVPVQITPEAFNFLAGQWAVNINRLTGVNIWTGPNTQHYVCSKGALPFPASKF